MIDQQLIELPEEPPEKPELEIMLSGCVTDAERKAVRDAFHTFAQGDPGGFSVQFAGSYSRPMRERSNPFRSGSERSWL